MALSKAYITAHREGGDDKITVVFNPTEYDCKRNARYTNVKAPGQNGAEVNYLGTDNADLSLSLTIDGFAAADSFTEPEDISSRVSALMSLAEADPKLHAPPKCTFTWGSFSFYGLVISVSAKHTMFTEEGAPVRATVSLTMKSQPGAAGAKASPRESPDRTKRRVLTQDTGLFRLAWDNYADAGEWRHIAEANDIRNPRRLETGAALIIPALTGKTL